MKNPFSSTPQRVTHRISTSPSPKAVPGTGVRKPAVGSPAPLNGLSGRCASCGGGRRR